MTQDELAVNAELLKDIMPAYPDWPKPGVLFRDIQGILLVPALRRKAQESLIEILPKEKGGYAFDSIICFDARGFIFGSPLADAANVPMVLARKPKKLPGDTVQQTYGTEYSNDAIEVQISAIKPGQRVLIHDDLLATGGTSEAAALIIQKLGGIVAGFHYLIELEGLPGRKLLSKYCTDDKIVSLIKY